MKKGDFRFGAGDCWADFYGDFYYGAVGAAGAARCGAARGYFYFPVGSEKVPDE